MEQQEILKLYSLMYKSRYFEETVKELWDEGKVFGEMHMGIGEEAIVAGVLFHVIAGDAILNRIIIHIDRLLHILIRVQHRRHARTAHRTGQIIGWRGIVVIRKIFR